MLFADRRNIFLLACYKATQEDVAVLFWKRDC